MSNFELIMSKTEFNMSRTRKLEITRNYLTTVILSEKILFLKKRKNAAATHDAFDARDKRSI